MSPNKLKVTPVTLENETWTVFQSLTNQKRSEYLQPTDESRECLPPRALCCNSISPRPPWIKSLFHQNDSNESQFQGFEFETQMTTMMNLRMERQKFAYFVVGLNPLALHPEQRLTWPPPPPVREFQVPKGVKWSDLSSSDSFAVAHSQWLTDQKKTLSVSLSLNLSRRWWRWEINGYFIRQHFIGHDWRIINQV